MKSLPARSMMSSVFTGKNMVKNEQPLPGIDLSSVFIRVPFPRCTNTVPKVCEGD